VHAAAIDTNDALHTHWRASAPDALLRAVIDALRERTPAAWRTRFRALRARFEPAAKSPPP
jgi:hypothetical protein